MLYCNPVYTSVRSGYPSGSRRNLGRMFNEHIIALAMDAPRPLPTKHPAGCDMRVVITKRAGGLGGATPGGYHHLPTQSKPPRAFEFCSGRWPGSPSCSLPTHTQRCSGKLCGVLGHTSVYNHVLPHALLTTGSSRTYKTGRDQVLLKSQQLSSQQPTSFARNT